jgi:hypothetical protein
LSWTPETRLESSRKRHIANRTPIVIENTYLFHNKLYQFFIIFSIFSIKIINKKKIVAVLRTSRSWWWSG